MKCFIELYAEPSLLTWRSQERSEAFYRPDPCPLRGDVAEGFHWRLPRIYLALLGVFLTFGNRACGLTIWRAEIMVGFLSVGSRRWRRRVKVPLAFAS